MSKLNVFLRNVCVIFIVKTLKVILLANGNTEFFFNAFEAILLMFILVLHPKTTRFLVKLYIDYQKILAMSFLLSAMLYPLLITAHMASGTDSSFLFDYKVIRVIVQRFFGGDKIVNAIIAGQISQMMLLADVAARYLIRYNLEKYERNMAMIKNKVNQTNPRTPDICTIYGLLGPAE